MAVFSKIKFGRVPVAILCIMAMFSLPTFAVDEEGVTEVIREEITAPQTAEPETDESETDVSESDEPQVDEPQIDEPQTDEPGTPGAASPFVMDETKKTEFTADEEILTLYLHQIFADVNHDGKYNSADSRELLRIAAKIVQPDGDIALYDINADGSLNSTDARLSLRYNARLDIYYRDENGSVHAGFYSDAEGNTYYLNDLGCMARGFESIEGNYYYFDINGVMQTGKQTVNGAMAYFAEDGKAATGFQTIDNKKYYFEKGFVKSGLKTIDGKTYFLTDGVPYTGWKYEGLNAYYFNADGVRAEKTKIGDISFDSNGVASTNVINKQTLQVYLRGILKKNGSSPQNIYSYVYNNFRYKYFDKASTDDMVVRILSGGRGACYDYANLTKYLLEIAGYECKIIVGDSFNPNNGSEHDWVLVKINGVWRHMDTQRGVYLKTDSQMRSLGYGWKAANYPAAK